MINYRAVGSRDGLVRNQDRNRKTFSRPRPGPAFFETLALIPRPGKFKTKTETEYKKLGWLKFAQKFGFVVKLSQMTNSFSQKDGQSDGVTKTNIS